MNGDMPALPEGYTLSTPPPLPKGFKIVQEEDGTTTPVSAPKPSKTPPPALPEGVSTVNVLGQKVTLRDEVVDPFTLASGGFNKKYGRGIGIESSYRSNEEQKEIRARHEKMPGGIKEHPAAEAGKSLHEQGRAIDVAPKDIEKARPFLLAQGFKNDIKNDPGHFYIPKGEDPFWTAQLKNASPQSKVRINALKDYLESDYEAKNTWDFLTRTVPRDAAQMVYGAVRMPGDLWRHIEQPDVSPIKENGTEKTSEEIADEKRDLRQEQVGNLFHGIMRYYGVYGREEAKDAWYKHPVGGVATASPFIRPTAGGLIRTAKATPELLFGRTPDINAITKPAYVAAQNSRIMKAFRPAFRKGTRTLEQQEAAKAANLNAVHKIIEDKPNLEIKNELGEKVETPTTLYEAQQAADQTLFRKLEQQEAMAQTADETGITGKTDKILAYLEKERNDPNVHLHYKDGASRAEELYQFFAANPEMTPLEMQKQITFLNRRTAEFQATPGVARGFGAHYVDNQVLQGLRSLQYETVESAGGKGYAVIRRDMHDIMNFQNDLNRRAWEYGKNAQKGIFDQWDIFTGYHTFKGIMSLEPSQLVASAGAKGISQWLKWMNNPDRMVQKLFKSADQAVWETKIAQGPPTIDAEFFDPRQLPAPPGMETQTAGPNIGTMREPWGSPFSPDLANQLAGPRQLEYTGKGTSLAEHAPPGRAGGLPPVSPVNRPSLNISPDRGLDVGMRPDRLFEIRGARPDFIRPQGPASPPGQARGPQRGPLVSRMPPDIPATISIFENPPQAEAIMNKAREAATRKSTRPLKLEQNTSEGYLRNISDRWIKAEEAGKTEKLHNLKAEMERHNERMTRQGKPEALITETRLQEQLRVARREFLKKKSRNRL